MLSAMYAAQNIFGADHDVWTVNVDRSYHEDFVRPGAAATAESHPLGQPAFTAADDVRRAG